MLALLSEPKPIVAFGPCDRPLSLTRFGQHVARRGLRLDPRTRLLYAGGRIGINGEVMRCGTADLRALSRLANARALSTHDCAALGESVLALLHQWYLVGWLHVD